MSQEQSAYSGTGTVEVLIRSMSLILPRVIIPQPLLTHQQLELMDLVRFRPLLRLGLAVFTRSALAASLLHQLKEIVLLLKSTVH
jgi:hypothetical protein